MLLGFIIGFLSCGALLLLALFAVLYTLNLVTQREAEREIMIETAKQQNAEVAALRKQLAAQ